MKRRQLLVFAAAALTLPLPAFAAERVFYVPGLAEAAMAEGKVVFLDFWTNWCSTCAAQDRIIDSLRAENPAYDKAITFITVNWDVYADAELSNALKIPRRSTLVALDGQTELGRIVAGTSKDEIKALLDQALDAGT